MIPHVISYPIVPSRAAHSSARISSAPWRPSSTTSSPTFTLVHSYDTSGPTLHHADLYRLDHLAEVADLALGELAEFDGIVLVEWGDVVESSFGEHLVVRLELLDGDVDARRIVISPTGPTWARRWPELTQRLERP